MSLKNLADKLYPTFIKNFSTDSTCKIFLSASDMKKRAIVRNAQGNSPADAWKIALEDLEKTLHTAGISPKILRADWIISSEKISWENFNKLIEQTERNYFRRGLALDTDFKIAFTEQELNANAIFDRDLKDKTECGIFNKKFADRYCQKRFGCNFPTPESSQTVEIFDTYGVFVQDGEEPKFIGAEKSYTGHRDLSARNSETVMNIVKKGGNYLARQVKNNGRFIYGYYPCFNQEINHYNTLRHAGTMFAMLDVYETYKKMPPMKLGKAIVNAADYIVKKFIKYRKLDDGTEAAYPDDKGDLKLGANGITLLALAKYTEIMHTKKYLPIMKLLANGILSMQNDDGSFVHVLNSEDFSVKEKFKIVYYDGEAIFGMLRLYSITKDEKLLVASEKAFDYFIKNNYWKYHDHWLAYATNELTLWRPEEKYFEFGINNFNPFLSHIYNRVGLYPIMAELFAVADKMLERMKTLPAMSKLLSKVDFNDFYATLERRTKILIDSVMFPEVAMYFENPEVIGGGIFYRKHSFRVRIDDVQHSLSGLVGYCRYLERTKNLPAPVPSKNLLNQNEKPVDTPNIAKSETKKTPPTETIDDFSDARTFVLVPVSKPAPPDKNANRWTFTLKKTPQNEKPVEIPQPKVEEKTTPQKISAEEKIDEDFDVEVYDNLSGSENAFIANEFFALKILSDKSAFNKKFAKFIRHDRTDTQDTIKINTFRDVHNVVHILAASGKFGGDFSAKINLETGILNPSQDSSDAAEKFTGSKYPYREKICDNVKEIAKVIPALRHIEWEIAVNAEGEINLLNASDGTNSDLSDKIPLYQSLLNELQNYKKNQLNDVGWRVNNLENFDSEYSDEPRRTATILKFAADKLISECKSLIDVGCRQSKILKTICPADVKYYPVDFKNYGDPEIIACDFQAGEFPKVKAETVFCALTAEYVADLPKFLENICLATEKQILMICCPVDKENNLRQRYNRPFLTDFTDKFLIETFEQENFKLNSAEVSSEDSSVMIYDFRRTATTEEKIPPAPMVEEKNIYGLSEGVIKACEFFGLKLPPENKIDSPFQEHFPSDYFGEDFELDLATMEKLQRASKLSKEKFSKNYGAFTKRFFAQKPLKHNETDLNVYFCDYVLFSKKLGAKTVDYFDFEFYRKSAAEQKTFRMQTHRELTRVICNNPNLRRVLDNKALADELFQDFIHRDWINTTKCSFEEFKVFAKKNPRFFSKPIAGSFGKGAEIIQVAENENLEQTFKILQSKKCILEGVISQHESLKAFCPDTVNTLRINTFYDVHNVVHILTTGGRFGRIGNVVDNFHGGGFSVIINPKTGVITSDGINKVHERSEIHPDTGKIFKGFQYPFWEKIRSTVIEMAKTIPQMRHIGWDIAINQNGDAEMVESNGNPDVDVQQGPDSVGRLYLYQSLVDEMQKYKQQQIKNLGWYVNNLVNFTKSYENAPVRHKDRLAFAMKNLIPGCESLIDVGCRQSKVLKAICPADVKYYPVDFKNYGDSEIIIRDLNRDNFSDIKADTFFCAITAEYITNLPQFLKNICVAAKKQILMLCRPADKELHPVYRWKNPFLTDFTEEFLIKIMSQNNFSVNEIKSVSDNKSVIVYDFRKI